MTRLQPMLTLYHAGHSGNSARALERLEKLVREYAIDSAAIELIDVFDHPSRALNDRVMMTPALRVIDNDKATWIFGDLGDASALTDLLQRAQPERA